MKKYVFTLLLLLSAAAVSLTSCSELSDESHYNDNKTTINNDELKIVNMKSRAYLKTRADLSAMTQFLEKDTIFDKLDKKGQLHTLLVVYNEAFKQPKDSVDFIAKAHVSDISISPANLNNGERLMMWHGKYVNVSIDDMGKQGYIIDHIMFNTAAIKEVIKTTDGYIYVISNMINTPTSLYDYINNLDDNYSILKNMVLESGSKEFDKANSKAIGINEQGNTVYDSVFIYKSNFFSSKNFDMNSESLTATMLLFSDDVINKALQEAKTKLESWGMERNEDTLKRWILKAAFYNKKYTKDEIQTNEINDLFSIYNSQWRTNIQKVDADNPIELSNGIVYKVKELHFPNNLLMYRLKDWFYYYENCTDEEKEKYFKGTNLTFREVTTDVDKWSPWPGVWPMLQDRILAYSQGDQGAESGWSLEFTPLMLKSSATGGYYVQPYRIPPGSYRLAMGFAQGLNMDITVTVMIGDKEIAKSQPITLGTSTTYHYDRGATLSNTYPEGYDKNYVSTNGGEAKSKAGNYDTDGGPIIDELTIPDLKGDGSAQEIKLKIDCPLWGATRLVFCHWCLRPTINNY